MRYLPEPEHRHGTIAKTAILLINLGTPDAPTPRAVRRYLEQFLSDPRVIEIPRALWLPILHGFVSTTASALDQVAEFLRKTRNAPEIRLVKHFHDHPSYIGSLAGLVHEHWRQSGRPDKLVMSFHGLPRFMPARGDPYQVECHQTARLLAERLELAENDWQVSFQSRFGRAQWIEPYTASILADYASTGVRRVDVICPGFVADCLETLEEIGIEGRKIFLGAGGTEFHLLPCLNERDDWIRALADIARQHLAGWGIESWNPQLERNHVEPSQSRALARGADV